MQCQQKPRGGRHSGPTWPQRRLMTRGVALVGVFAISVGWTVEVVQGGPTPDRKPARQEALPISDEPPEWPASTTVPTQPALGVASRDRVRPTSSAPVDDIPLAAFAAYQRAEAVINKADESCHLPWQLLAAIGRIESDHGRFDRNVVDAEGVSRPGVYGPRLDGTHGTARISDTDAGRVDTDPVHDRAVGPMQIIPSTWTQVAVDADGDGRRNPQDVDDAALAGAVYLCSGIDDLSTDAGLRRAVLRYNNSQQYVEQVLSIMQGYLAGEYTQAPNSINPSITLVADHLTGPVRPAVQPGDSSEDPGVHGSHADQPTGPTPDPVEPPEPTPDPSPPAHDDPLAPIIKTVDKTRSAVEETVAGVLTVAQAIAACAAKGYNPLLTARAWRECIADHTA